MMVKKQNSEGHNSGSDRYLITYADLITLLLGLFVILYSSSQVDQTKFKAFSAAIKGYFQPAAGKILEGGDGVLEGNKEGVPQPILLPTSQKTMDEIKSEANIMLKSMIDKGMVEIRQDGDKLTISLPEKLLFASGKSDIQNGAYEVLDSLAKIFRGSQKNFTIDGHTDIDPIKNFQFQSNWHLSVARAMNIAYELIQRKVPEYNMIVRGFGSQRPIADNTTLEGKARNRRVEIGISEPTVESATTGAYTKNDSILKK